jgi:hypothetical protein
MLPLQVLSYHVIPSAAVLSSQLRDGQNVTTALAAAAPLRVRIANGNVTFIGAATNATVIGADIRAGSSVIHVIDDVLLPTLPAGNSTGNSTAENVTAADGATQPPVYATIGEALTAANTSATNLTILLAAVQVGAANLVVQLRLLLKISTWLQLIDLMDRHCMQQHGTASTDVSCIRCMMIMLVSVM